IALGTVTNVDEAVEWLSYTYLYNSNASQSTGLWPSRMEHKEVFNEMFKEHMPEPDVLSMLSHSQEFEQVKVSMCHMIKHPRMGTTVKNCVEQIPAISWLPVFSNHEDCSSGAAVNQTRVSVNDRVHGSTSEPWWIWVEDPDNNHIYHSEYFYCTRNRFGTGLYQVLAEEEQTLVFTIPIFEPLPSQYYVRGVSDRWLGSEVVCALSFKHLILPEKHPPHTELLDLQPLPITALKCKEYELLYPR
ncbi:activating signal cointegrator 1 complex subunit, partial [Desmophyllum pertusum]